MTTVINKEYKGNPKYRLCKQEFESAKRIVLRCEDMLGIEFEEAVIGETSVNLSLDARPLLNLI